MNTVEADQIIKQYLEEQTKTLQMELFRLRTNLKTFIAKELKKENFTMKADTLAVAKMNREQLINLIISYHWLFPHLIDKKETKRYPTAVATRRRRPLTKPRKQPKPVQTGIPPASITITPELRALIERPTN